MGMTTGSGSAGLKLNLLVTTFALLAMPPAAARPGTIKTETYACTSWGAAHEYTMQSLTPKGGQFSKNCPIRISKGSKVDIVKEDDDGYAVVTYQGKTWWVDGERVK
jgi:hypothetical protein